MTSLPHALVSPRAAPLPRHPLQVIGTRTGGTPSGEDDAAHGTGPPGYLAAKIASRILFAAAGSRPNHPAQMRLRRDRKEKADGAATTPPAVTPPWGVVADTGGDDVGRRTSCPPERKRRLKEKSRPRVRPRRKRCRFLLSAAGFRVLDPRGTRCPAPKFVPRPASCAGDPEAWIYLSATCF